MENINGLRVIATYACNKNCPFCYQKTKKSTFLSVNSLYYDINRNDLDDIKYITVMGGEVSDFPEKTISLIDVIKRRFPDKPISVTTNGYGKLNFYIELSYKVNNISFSLPAPNFTIQDKILGVSGNVNVRVNSFLNGKHIENSLCILYFCKTHGIDLTYCTDIRIKELFDYGQIFGYNIDVEQFPLYDVCNYDEFKFRVYHNHNYEEHDKNLIILPNGDMTFDFNDVIEGKGAYA